MSEWLASAISRVALYDRKVFGIRFDEAWQHHRPKNDLRAGGILSAGFSPEKWTTATVFTTYMHAPSASSATKSSNPRALAMH